MPKAATNLPVVKFPKDLPSGIETIQCSRTVSSGTGDDKKTVKGATVSFHVPVEGSAEGVTNFISLLSQLGPGDNYGVRFAAQALRSAVVSGMTSQLTPANHGDSLTLLPPVLSVRTIDSAQAAGDKLEEFMRDEGRMPTPTEYKELFKEIS